MNLLNKIFDEEGIFRRREETNANMLETKFHVIKRFFNFSIVKMCTVQLLIDRYKTYDLMSFRKKGIDRRKALIIASLNFSIHLKVEPIYINKLYIK